VFGDSKIIVQQVRNTIHFMSPHLKSYQQEVWNILYSFDAFNITSIPRNQNIYVDILPNATSMFISPDDVFSVEMIFMLSILDNITNRRVFNNDIQIINCITSLYSSQDAVIDDEAKVRQPRHLLFKGKKHTFTELFKRYREDL
jgi:hypothetical protein